MSQTLSCIIVDDEHIGIRLIEAFLAKLPHVTLLASFEEATEALDFLKKHHVDILITDIQMPGLNGLDMVRSLAFPPEVIFTTAHRDFAADGFDVNAVDFLLKPLNFARFQMAVNKARQRLQSRWIFYQQKTDFLFIKQERGHVKVLLDDIACLEAMGDYVKISIADHSNLVTRSTLTDIESKLPSDRFIRVHKSFIVNTAMIINVNQSQLILKDGTEIPIAKSYKAGVNKKIGIA